MRKAESRRQGGVGFCVGGLIQAFENLGPVGVFHDVRLQANLQHQMGGYRLAVLVVQVF
jgi:hypothetical protein